MNAYKLSLHQTKQQAWQSAYMLFQRAAKEVPAYNKLLTTARIKTAHIKNSRDFKQLPIISKQNYITKNRLRDLCWHASLDTYPYIVSSSGSTGLPFFWPRGPEQDAISSAMYANIFTEIFKLHNKKTLLVNCYGQGTWVAGTEVYNAVIDYAKHHSVTVTNPGIEVEQALRHITTLGKEFQAVILTGYPPFIKDIVDELKQTDGLSGIKTLKIITGGEAISEPWRHNILKRLGLNDAHHNLINVYGMSDGGGLLGHETPLTIAIRQFMSANPGHELTMLCGGPQTISLYQYYPTVRYFEVGPDRQLLLTSPAGTPLIRYNTKDQGGIVWPEEILNIQNLPKSIAAYLKQWNLPLVYLCGRQDLAASYYAVNIYPEHIKEILESSPFSNVLTGRFVLSTQLDKKLNQYLQLEIECISKDRPTKLTSQISRYVGRALPRLNSEYGELHDKLGNQTLPHVKLVTFGDLIINRGSKQKWVKRA